MSRIVDGDALIERRRHRLFQQHVIAHIQRRYRRGHVELIHRHGEIYFPLTFNRVEIHDGSVHFRTYNSNPSVDVYLHELEGRIENLTNIEDDMAVLVSSVFVEGAAMEQAPFDFRMTLDPFSYYPTFELAMRLTDLDLALLATGGCKSEEAKQQEFYTAGSREADATEVSRGTPGNGDYEHGLRCIGRRPAGDIGRAGR